MQAALFKNSVMSPSESTALRVRSISRDKLSLLWHETPIPVRPPRSIDAWGVWQQFPRASAGSARTNRTDLRLSNLFPCPLSVESGQFAVALTGESPAAGLYKQVDFIKCRFDACSGWKVEWSD